VLALVFPIVVGLIAYGIAWMSALVRFAPGIYGEFSWAFVLEGKGERNTRLIVRTRASYGPRIYRALTMPFVLVGGEYFTTRKMVYGIKRRVEQTTRLTPA
jgi:hypothetical protein